MRANRILAIAILFSFTAATAFPQQDFSKVEVKVVKVTDGIYMLQGSGGNIAISVGEDGVVMIDAEFAPLATKIKAAIKSVTDQPIRFLLNTHYHFDHTGGNPEFSKDSTIIAHDNVRRRMEKGDPPKLAGRDNPPSPKAALPIITFDNSLTVHLNGEDIRALHFASGHTDGDSIIFFPKANVVHMGDDFVTYGFPFVDAAGGGSILGLVENAEKAMAAVPDDVKVIPGHGPLSTKADVKKFTMWLRECIDLVQAGIKKGRTLDQLKKDNVLGKWDTNPNAFIKGDSFTELIYTELTDQKSKIKYLNHGHADEKP
jgi:glyoxylase-like metal-dependent hydrolase (beta-lactamase superfamily II)